MFCTDPETVLMAVVDGLGGQPAGHIAAQKAVRDIKDFLPGTDIDEKSLSNLLINLYKYVARLAETDPGLEYMGTILTLANFLVEEGEITEKQALNHSMQNLLYQSIGSGDCEPKSESFPISSGDIVLLCSDGLYSTIRPEQIKDTLLSNWSILEKPDL